MTDKAQTQAEMRSGHTSTGGDRDGNAGRKKRLPWERWRRKALCVLMTMEGNTAAPENQMIEHAWDHIDHRWGVGAHKGLNGRLPLSSPRGTFRWGAAHLCRHVVWVSNDGGSLLWVSKDWVVWVSRDGGSLLWVSQDGWYG